MKVFAKYKTKICFESRHSFIRFCVKLRLESKRYKIFANIIEFLPVENNNWDRMYALLENDGVIKVVERYVKQYYDMKQHKKLKNIALHKVDSLLNKKWKEIELDIVIE